MEDVRAADYIDAKRIYKNFHIKQLGEYHDLYLKSDTLILVDVFEILQKNVLNIYHLDLVEFFQRLDQHGKQL